jgi:hypothetical protein
MIDKSCNDTNFIHTEVIKYAILVHNSMRVTQNCDVMQRFVIDLASEYQN